MKATLLFLLLSMGRMASALDESACFDIFYDDSNGNWFDILNFTLHPLILRDDSTISLAQAGTYTGPQEYREYISFATFLAPYVAAGPIFTGFNRNFLQYNNETDTCDYLLTFVADYTLDGTYANEAVTLNVAYMIKYEFLYSDPYLKDSYIYYPTPYLEYFFGSLENDNMTEYICDQLVFPCNNTLDTDPFEACLSNFDALPVSEGDEAHVDGNSKGCRDVHTVLAAFSPDDHCPHVSLSPMEDPKGRIKCQESANVQPTDLFTPVDFAIFEEWQNLFGIDPEVGFFIYDDEEEDVDMEGGVTGAPEESSGDLTGAPEESSLDQTEAPEPVSKDGSDEAVEKKEPTASGAISMLSGFAGISAIALLATSMLL